MVYCKNCGKEADSASKFCKNCGGKIVTTTIKTTPIKKINWKLIIWIIVIVCLLLLVLNIASNSGSIGTSSSKSDKWWGTSHEKTTYGLGGKKTTSHSCPFWDRDC